jgi:hypothetical protein
VRVKIGELLSDRAHPYSTIIAETKCIVARHPLPYLLFTKECLEYFSIRLFVQHAGIWTSNALSDPRSLPIAANPPRPSLRYRIEREAVVQSGADRNLTSVSDGNKRLGGEKLSRRDEGTYFFPLVLVPHVKNGSSISGCVMPHQSGLHGPV